MRRVFRCDCIKILVSVAVFAAAAYGVFVVVVWNVFSVAFILICVAM